MDIADKIRKIEALIAGAKNEGERQAAEFAKRRLEDKIADQTVEYSVRLDSSWKKRLFLAICHKHNLQTYRYARQKSTTSMVRVSKSFMHSVLWPEFNKYASILDKLTHEILIDLTSKIHLVSEEGETVIAGDLPVLNDSANFN